MFIQTVNSTYQVVAHGSHFLVTKVAENRPNPNGINVGWFIVTPSIEITIGSHATFGSMRTSIVTSIFETQGEIKND